MMDLFRKPARFHPRLITTRYQFLFLFFNPHIDLFLDTGIRASLTGFFQLLDLRRDFGYLGPRQHRVNCKEDVHTAITVDRMTVQF